MRIRFTKPITITADRGQIVDLPDFQAAAFVERGVAEVLIDLDEVSETATLAELDLLYRHESMREVQ